jgi:hypothetical protein
VGIRPAGALSWVSITSLFKIGEHIESGQSDLADKGSGYLVEIEVVEIGVFTLGLGPLFRGFLEYVQLC